MAKRKTMNLGKADIVIRLLNLKNAKKIVSGNEECVLINCDEKYIEKLQKQKLPINGAFSKAGFVLCNLHNLTK